MYSGTGDTTSLAPGFPIRTSSDPRSVDSSPRHIAASHVLHRPLMPRHPPCALKHLQTQKPIVEKSKLHHNKPPPHHEGMRDGLMLATTIHESNTTPHHQSRATTHRPHQRAATPATRGTGLLSQDPTVCLAVILEPEASHPGSVVRLYAPEPHPLQATAHPTTRSAHRTPTRCGRD